MSDGLLPPTALGDAAARQLANATRTVPHMGSLTPRWLMHSLHWVPVEAGIFRLNRLKDASMSAQPARRAEHQLLGALHGHQPQSECLTPDVTILHLLAYATRQLDAGPGLRLLARARQGRGAVLRDGRRAHRGSGAGAQRRGIAARAGHHCAQSILRRLGVEGAVRASLALYNVHADINRLVAALLRVRSARPAAA